MLATHLKTVSVVIIIYKYLLITKQLSSVKIQEYKQQIKVCLELVEYFKYRIDSEARRKERSRLLYETKENYNYG